MRRGSYTNTITRTHGGPGRHYSRKNNNVVRAVWQPAVPSWEKEFTLKMAAGLYSSWDEFVEAKKYVHPFENVMQWDDKASRDSFLVSKAIFHANKFNIREVLEALTPLDDPDLWVDKIDGDDLETYDSELLEGLGSASDKVEDGNKKREESNNKNWIAIEDINKPTGWDDEPEDFCQTLTGLIVGGP